MALQMLVSSLSIEETHTLDNQPSIGSSDDDKIQSRFDVTWRHISTYYLLPYIKTQF